VTKDRRRGDRDQRATLAPGSIGAPNVRLIRKIAEGGMGSVWEGEHLSLKTPVAVKFVLGELEDNEEALARFAREATATARIRSPHVVQVFDHGKNEEGVPYMVMELLEGEDLEARLEREVRLPVSVAVQVVLQAAKAMAKAHDLGIVHRDIKPANVFLTDLEGEIFVKLLDFGIAKLSQTDPSRMSMTQTGAVIGTPYFMAPEQMTSAKDAGPASDVWSLGVIAYKCITGRLPYESDTLPGLAMAIERGTVVPATSIVPDLPAGIDEWFQRALAKDPAARFATVRDMAEELAKLFRVPHGAVGTSTPPPSMAGARAVPSSDPPGKAEDRPLASPAITLTRAPTEMSSTKALNPSRSKSSGRALVAIVMVGVTAGAIGVVIAIGAFGVGVGGDGRSQSPAQPNPSALAAPSASEQASASASASAAGSAEIPEPEVSASAAVSASASASASAAPTRPGLGQRPPAPKPPPTTTASSPKPPASGSAPPPKPAPSASAPAPKASASAPAPKTTSSAPKPN
jgi:serine/threonine-protein kinase